MNDTLELAALKDAWRALDRKLERQHALERELFRARHLTRAKLHLYPLWVAALVQLAVGVAVVVPAASFWLAHRDEPGPLVAGLALHIYGIGVIGLAVGGLLQLARLDFSAPLLTLQTRLAALHEQRVNATLWLGLPWWILWFALPLCLARAFAGIDLHARAPGWVLGNLLVGVVGLVVSLLFVRRLRCRGSALASGSLGFFLTRARRELESLARFEREE